MKTWQGFIGESFFTENVSVRVVNQKIWGRWILDMDGFFGGQFQIFQVEFLKHVSFRSDARHDPEATTFRFYKPKNTNLP